MRADFDDIDVELIEGAHGVFDIRMGDTLIFSKRKVGCCGDRFPRRGEITEIVRRLGI